jgi:predicted transglutaminase-like cysteine proteinase
MRKITMVTMLIILITGCQIVPADLPKVESIEEAVEWVHNNITYKTDMEVHGIDQWTQSSFETMRRRTGDCEDFNFLLRDILIDSLGINTSVAVLDDPGMATDHAVILFKDGRVADSIVNVYCKDLGRYNNLIETNYHVIGYMYVATW